MFYSYNTIRIQDVLLITLGFGKTLCARAAKIDFPCAGLLLGIDRYDHTNTDTYTDYPVWIHIKLIPIPIILFGFISNRYRFQLSYLDLYQTDTDTDISVWFHIKPISIIGFNRI